MPRPTVKTPSYRKHRASGQAVVTLNGTDHYLGRYGSKASRNEYDRLVAQWLSAGRQLPGDTGEATTVAEVLVAYLRHAREIHQRDGKPTGEYGKITLALAPVRRLFGRTPAVAFGPLSLRACRETYVEAGLGRAYVNDQVQRVKRCFRWATEVELVPPSVWHGITAVTGLRRGRTTATEGKRVLPVPEGHIEAVKPFVSAEVAAMIEVQLHTGMRPQEVCTMRRADIDTSGDVWLYKPQRHKTQDFGHERVVEIGPRCQEIIKPFLTLDLQDYIFSPDRAMEAHYAARRDARASKVTPSQAKRRRKAKPKRKPRDCYDTSSYRRAIHRACDKAEIPKWSPHRLRHNFGTLVRKRYGLEVARILLGHRSAVVSEWYAEVDRDRVRAAIADVG